MLLDSHAAVHQMVADFDPGKGEEIGEYFKQHNVDATGLIHYGVVMARAALQEPRTTAVETLVALFCSGAALGLHLADETSKSAERTHMTERGGDYAAAIGIARLELISGDPQGALDALDDAVDRSHRKHYDALIADGHDRETIERFLGPRETSKPRRKVGEGV